MPVKIVEFLKNRYNFADGYQSFAGNVSILVHDNIIEFYEDSYFLTYEDMAQVENWDSLYLQEVITTSPDILKNIKDGKYQLYFEADMLYSHSESLEGTDYDIEYVLKKLVFTEVKGD